MSKPVIRAGCLAVIALAAPLAGFCFYTGRIWMKFDAAVRAVLDTAAPETPRRASAALDAPKT